VRIRGESGSVAIIGSEKVFLGKVEKKFKKVKKGMKKRLT
jgi:hypothetical protein